MDTVDIVNIMTMVDSKEILYYVGKIYQVSLETNRSNGTDLVIFGPYWALLALIGPD